jgi:hypothetical protein
LRCSPSKAPAAAALIAAVDAAIVVAVATAVEAREVVATGEVAAHFVLELEGWLPESPRFPLEVLPAATVELVAVAPLVVGVASLWCVLFLHLYSVAATGVSATGDSATGVSATGDSATGDSATGVFRLGQRRV